jgi:hypothetical protein
MPMPVVDGLEVVDVEEGELDCRSRCPRHFFRQALSPARRL